MNLDKQIVLQLKLIPDAPTLLYGQYVEYVTCAPTYEQNRLLT